MDDSFLSRREYASGIASVIAISIAGCGADDSDDGSASPADATDATADGSPPADGTSSGTAAPADRRPADGIEPHEASLIVSPDMYPALREREGEDPWQTWARDARSKGGGSVSVGGSLRNQSDRIHNKTSASALAYILEPDERDRYAETVADAIEVYHDELYPEIGGGWKSVVPLAGSYFTCVLALDVVQAHLDDDTVSDLESKLADVADRFWELRDRAWPEARIGAYGVWAAYEGDAERLQVAAFQQLGKMQRGFQSSVYRAGSDYANARFAGSHERNAKMHFLDVLDFASDIDVYDAAAREWLHDGFEWLYGYSVTPIVTGGSRPRRENYTFGDSGLSSGSATSSSTYRADKFGGDVENAAAWALVGENPQAATSPSSEAGPKSPPTNQNRLLAYVLTESVPSDPDRIPSKVFEEGAWFHGDSHDVETLAGALWNIRADHGHNHPDTNAIHCCAYGEHVIRNAGYNGWQNGSKGFTWEYIHDSAVGQNVALVDYEIEDPRDPSTDGHAEKVGAGVREGFVDDPGPVAWACGDSGPAIAGATHRRNFVFVPAQDGANGYWLLLDSIAAEDADKVHTALHPNTESGVSPTTSDDGVSRTVPVGGRRPRSDNDVHLSIAYGTEPDTVETYEGVLADPNDAFVGRYFYATYPAADSGRTGLVTALFPHDADHAKAEFARKDGVNGLEISQGDVTDHVAYLGGTDSTIGSVRAIAESVFFREGGDATDRSFVRNATLFRRGNSWFRAEDPVTVSLAGTEGNIATRTETLVNFGHPGIERVELEGTATSFSIPNGDFLELTVPAGSHELTIVTE
jgi:hypothetical protein